MSRFVLIYSAYSLQKLLTSGKSPNRPEGHPEQMGLARNPAQIHPNTPLSSGKQFLEGEIESTSAGCGRDSGFMTG